MGKLISSLIVAFFLGGVAVMIQQQPEWAYGLWFVAFSLLLVLLWYLPQRVYIRDARCYFDPSLHTESSEQLYVTFEGFVKARHRDGLKGIQLHLAEDTLSPVNSVSIPMPEVIDYHYQKFKATFYVQFFMLQKGREEQEKGKAIDWASLGVTLSDGERLTNPFKIPSREDEIAGTITLKKKREKQ